MTIVLRRANSIPGVAAAFLTERQRIAAAVPTAEVVHTGATSIGSLLTRGDLDIHVRVPSAYFAAAAAALGHMYRPYRPEMWTVGFAAYTRALGTLPIGVALTSIGGEHDRRFKTAWDRLATDEALIDEYNALKLRHAGGDETEYEAEKAAFFTRVAEETRLDGSD